MGKQMEEARKESRNQLWNESFVLLSIVNFFSWLSYNMVTPILTGYMESLSASVTVCGIAGGIFAFTSCLSRPFSGVLTDSVNHKKLLVIFSFLMAFSLLVYSFSPNTAVILIFRGIHGIAFGISSTASLVMVSECVDLRRMGEAVSYYGVMSVASMAVGPSMGIAISSRMGYRNCLVISSGILFIAAALAFFIPNQQAVKKERKQGTIKAGDFIEVKLLGLCGVNAAFTMMNGVVSAFLVAFAARQGIAGVHWHFTLNAAALILFRVILAKHINEWSLKQNLYPAFITGILTLVCIGFANSLFLLLIAAVLKAFAAGMSQPSLQTEAMKSTKAERRGTAASTMYIGGDFGQAAGPILGGIIADRAGYSLMYLMGIIPLLLAGAYYVLREKRRSGKKESCRA